MKKHFGMTALSFCGAAVLSFAFCGCATDKVEPAKAEAPKVEAPKVEAPKVEAPKVEAPKVEAPKVEAPAEVAKVEAPAAPAQVEAPKADPFLALPEVIAEGNGIKVTREDVRAALMKMLPNGQLPPIAPEQLKQFAAGQSKMLAFMQALDQEIKKANFAPTDDEIKAFVAQILHEQPQLEKMLAAQGKTVDAVAQEVLAVPEEKQGVVEQMFVRKVVVVPNVAEADAKKFYDANPDKFTTPADGEKTLRASHILIMVDPKADDAAKQAAETKANEVLAKVKADPASFEKLAAEVSACPSGKQSGGDLGAFEPEQMIPEFAKATAALKPGEISGLVKTQFGYHIIRRNAPQGAKLIPFDQIKTRLVDVMTQKAKQDALMAYMEKINQEYGVKCLIPEAPKPAVAK